MAKSRTILRSVLILSSIGVITSAVTFAALQSQQAVLAGNTINSATAALVVSSDGTMFGSSKSGFVFSNVVPGGAAVPTGGNTVYLRNNGSSNLSLKMSVSSTPSNLNNVDLSKVFVEISRAETSYNQTYSLKSLIDSYASGGTVLNDTVNSGTTAQYLLRVAMSADAFNNTNGVTISGVDIAFVGLAI